MRFDPDPEALKRSLAWHAEITVKLQARILEARTYVKSHSGDPKLLAILGPSAHTGEPDHCTGCLAAHQAGYEAT